MDTKYKEEYKSFMDRVSASDPIDGKSIGEIIVRLAHYFSDALSEKARTEYAYQQSLASLEKTTDDAGKTLSSTKAENFAKSTPQYSAYLEAEAHTIGIETMINSLKSYQKGVLNEYSHMGNT